MGGKNKRIRMTPFMAFMQFRRKQLAAQGKHFPGGYKDIAQYVNDEWTSLSESQKKRWGDRGRTGNFPGASFQRRIGDVEPRKAPKPKPTSESDNPAQLNSSGLQTYIVQSPEPRPPVRGPRGWFDNMEKDYFSLVGETGEGKQKQGFKAADSANGGIEILEILDGDLKPVSFSSDAPATATSASASTSTGTIKDEVEVVVAFSSPEEQAEVERQANYYAPDLFKMDFDFVPPECGRNGGVKENGVPFDTRNRGNPNFDDF